MHPAPAPCPITPGGTTTIPPAPLPLDNHLQIGLPPSGTAAWRANESIRQTSMSASKAHTCCAFCSTPHAYCCRLVSLIHVCQCRGCSKWNGSLPLHIQSAVIWEQVHTAVQLQRASASNRSLVGRSALQDEVYMSCQRDCCSAEDRSKKQQLVSGKRLKAKSTAAGACLQATSKRIAIVLIMHSLPMGQHGAHAHGQEDARPKAYCRPFRPVSKYSCKDGARNSPVIIIPLVAAMPLALAVILICRIAVAPAPPQPGSTQADRHRPIRWLGSEHL